MSRKYKDESAPFDAFDLTPPGDLDESAILKIATDFHISDEVGFLADFKFWAAVYRNNKAGFRNVGTVKQRRDSAERIYAAADTLVSVLEETGTMTIRDVRIVSFERLGLRFSNDEIDELIRSGAIGASTRPECGDIALEDTILRLKLLMHSVSSLLPLMDKMRTEIGNTSPLPDMDRRVLMNNLREFWEIKLERKFSRWFDYEPDEASRRATDVLLPKNSCSVFVLTCAQLIDRTLTVDMIAAEMKENISQSKKLNE